MFSYTNLNIVGGAQKRTGKKPWDCHRERKTGGRVGCGFMNSRVVASGYERVRHAKRGRDLVVPDQRLGVAKVN